MWENGENRKKNGLNRKGKTMGYQVTFGRFIVKKEVARNIQKKKKITEKIKGKQKEHKRFSVQTTLEKWRGFESC